MKTETDRESTPRPFVDRRRLKGPRPLDYELWDENDKPYQKIYVRVPVWEKHLPNGDILILVKG